MAMNQESEVEAAMVRGKGMHGVCYCCEHRDTLAAEVRRLQAENAERDGRIRQLEAACILGDAAEALVRKTIIKENEMLAPYISLKADYQEIQASIAAKDAQIEALERVVGSAIRDHCFDGDIKRRCHTSHCDVCHSLYLLDALKSKGAEERG